MNLDEDLIDILDDLAVMMSEGGVMPSRSEIARSILWAGIALIRSPDPRTAELLTLLRQESETTSRQT